MIYLTRRHKSQIPELFLEIDFKTYICAKEFIVVLIIPKNLQEIVFQRISYAYISMKL